ncbi:hypothetical protein TWF694_009585 [Orbilia ellipsospora]|uniref:Uncharacterized protein n=1 Tax=Orbilia ellipsospora TaxID=2528407 RepID=A0AAV9XCA6_9PEZI
MAPQFYLDNQRVAVALEKILNHEQESSIWLWQLIATAELPRSDGWFFSYMGFESQSIRVTHMARKWFQPTSDEFQPIRYKRNYLVVIAWPHHLYEFGKHHRFEYDAREAILQVMTCGCHDTIGDFNLICAAVSELCVSFWEWSGRQFGMPSLTGLHVEDPETGENCNGALHIVNDAGKVHTVLQYIKHRAESLVDQDGIDVHCPGAGT